MPIMHRQQARIGLLLPLELLARLEAEANTSDRSFNDVIRGALRLYLDGLEFASSSN